MDGLIASLLDQHAALPDAVREAAPRRRAREALESDGLPGPRAESWKYTPLRALARRRFEAARGARPGAALAEQVRRIPGPRLVLVNGRWDAALSELSGLPVGLVFGPLSERLAHGEGARCWPGPSRGEEAVFARINTLLARTAAGCASRPVPRWTARCTIVHVAVPEAAEVAWHLRTRIELGAGARARLCERFLGDGPHRNLGTAVVEIALGEGALLEHLVEQDEGAGSALFRRTEGTLAAASCYRRLDLELGGGLSRHELCVVLDGAGAALHASGVLLGEGSAHLDTRLAVDHAAAGARSSLLWRGLGRGRARIAFHGGILIRPGADGSDAALANKNLLLSPEAEIDTRPVLEIHADEVKAAHGATVGRLDADALFYLRARGVPRAQAEALLTAAFCLETVALLSDPALAAQAGERLRAALGGGMA
ncbi:MAG: Fe-S cluster assembly protein SufD [Lysobacteraceae bacterium]|nr:MAG: Fe-S cluster assembly protein SufD [Xanthomonadaceae bacterium]